MTHDEVLRVLAESKDPLTAKEVYQKLKSKKHISFIAVSSSLSKLDNMNDVMVTLKLPAPDELSESQKIVKAYIINPKLRSIYRKRRR